MKPFVSITQVINEVRIQAQDFLIVKALFSFYFHSSLPLCVPWTATGLSVLVVLEPLGAWVVWRRGGSKATW